MQKADCDPTPEDVEDFCRGEIGWYKIPKYVAFVTGYPLTASGKVQRYELQERPVDLFPEADAG
jgi:fatty-acyl-CoA synthase